MERIAHTVGVEVGAFFLFSGRENAGRLKPPNRKAKIVGKLAVFLKKAEVEDLRILFKLAKRLTRKRRDP